jgi:hypothetical protein
LVIKPEKERKKKKNWMELQIRQASRLNRKHNFILLQTLWEGPEESKRE